MQSRIAIILLFIAAVLVGANGAWMLLDPAAWFQRTPQDWRTGFPSPHFVRDVGWSYLSIGGACSATALVGRWQTTLTGISIGVARGARAHPLG
ncbi:MAG: hypothetical protein WBD27_11070 [Pyrinomonadaceae bacterium]